MDEVFGLSVLARDVLPGDVVMNEWTGKIMTVERVELSHLESVQLHCVMPDGKHETLTGDWKCITKLITRTVAANKANTTISNYGAWDALNAKKPSKLRRVKA